MDEHEELKKQAEELAEGKKTAELAKMAFIYAYVANHELRLVIERMSSMQKVVWGVLVVIVISLIGRFLFGL